MIYNTYKNIETMLDELPKEITNSKVNYELDDSIISLYNNGTMFTKNMIESLGLNNLTSFSLPLSYIIDNDIVIGVEEKKIEFHEFDITDIDTKKLFGSLNRIKKDLELLSSNSLLLRNINFTYNNEEIILTNILESIEIFNLDYNKLFSENITIMNKFLIGLIIYNVYKENKYITEEEKNKINKYNNTYCEDKFFGDVLKEMFSFEEKDTNNKNL